MKVQYIQAWKATPILLRIRETTDSGKLWYAAKKNAARLAPHYEDCMDKLKAIVKDSEYETIKDAAADEAVNEEFMRYLLDERFDFEPHRFPESLIQHVDGISGEDISKHVAWLFTENEPKEEGGSDDEQ